MNSNRNRQIPRVQEEKNVIDAAHRDAHTGALIGGATAAGTASLLLKKKRLLGIVGSGALGAVSGAAAGRRIGIDRGAKDVRDARKALNQQRQLAALTAEVNDLVMRQTERDGVQFETIDGATAAKPIRPGQHPVRIYPKAKGPFVPGNGIDDQEAYEMSPLRQKLIEVYGIGIVSALADDELSEENCRRLRDQVLDRQSQANGPRAGGDRSADFARQFLETKLGQRAVAQMSNAEVICHFEACRRKGLVELGGAEATTDLALVNRVRNDEGEFAPESQVNSQAVQRAYARNPKDRTTGKTASTVGALGAAAGLAGAIAHLRGRKGKRPRLTGGSVPQLGFAAKDDGSHPVRDTLAGVGAGALGAAALLALRKRRQLRLPTGVPKLPPKTIDVETQVMSRRIPVLTSFVRGPGSYIIRRATLRGKKQPGVPKLKIAGKKKPTSLAFLIHDPDFPIVPMKQPKLPPGTYQRVKPAKTRAEVLKRLRAMTELSAGSAVAEGLIDAASLGGLAGETPAQRRARQARISQQQQNAANDSDIANDSTAQPRTLDSALDRLANMNFGIGDAVTRGAARFAPEVAAIGAGDVIGESVHDRLKAAQDKKRRRLMRQGGIQATPGMGTAPGVQTTMSAVHDTLLEFDHGNERTARAKRNGTTVAAAGAGGVAGAIAGLKHDSGVPIRASDLQPGMRVTKRFGPAGLFQHVGVIDESGRVVHRTSGSSKLRSVKPSTFQKTGKGPLRHEVHSDDLPPRQAAANASRAAGTRAGRYSACQGNNCQDAAERLISKGKPVSRQLRKALGGAAIGAAGLGSVAHILNNRRKDK